MFCLCFFCPPPSLTSLLSPSLCLQPISQVHTTSYAHVHARTHTPWLVILLALWSLHLLWFLFHLSQPLIPLLFLALSTAEHDLTWPELSIPPSPSWMQILKCDKSFRFLSSHFAVATESKTLNTTPMASRLFTELSILKTIKQTRHLCVYIYNMHAVWHISIHILIYWP